MTVVENSTLAVFLRHGRFLKIACIFFFRMWVLAGKSVNCKLRALPWRNRRTSSAHKATCENAEEEISSFISQCRRGRLLWLLLAALAGHVSASFDGDDPASWSLSPRSQVVRDLTPTPEMLLLEVLSFGPV
jgi:hypothetical protein